jgi:uncharacterized OB-fold protein
VIEKEDGRIWHRCDTVPDGPMTIKYSAEEKVWLFQNEDGAVAMPPVKFCPYCGEALTVPVGE